MSKVFVGFGFGAIQAGLFLKEAGNSGNFDRLIVSEISPSIVENIRANKGFYGLNIATDEGID
ncbi:MAG: hypothetical protein GX804_05890, partial [Lentisphaerae bacterium]|nr:hypothetical protein [Lentisphaerota bacterium]